MKSSPVNTVSTGEKGLGHKEVRDGVGNHRRGLSEEGNSKIHEVSKAIRCESQMTTRTRDGPEKLQPQPPGPVVCWERFLPLRSLKVLLVENDDCTRHIVSALLRNCSYEVSAAENGVQAWKILQDPKNHIDLVLTEAVMPCLSGIGLLYKIMNHDYSKNIPVIMMSSHDSMGIVFKCLSKGAVDFLVKPIRKNELKNLWQHVWRRCHSSSGSGSESGTQSKRSTKVESVEGSDNDTGSNNENDNGSTEGAADESDNGSGTQSSWTKRAVDIGSLQAHSSCPDSASAQAILLKHEGSRRERVSATTREREEQDEESHEEVQMGKDLKIGVPGNQNLQNENSSEKVHPDLMNQDKLPFIDLGKASVRSNERALELDRGILSGEVRTLATADKISLISNCVDPAVETGFAEAPHGLLKPFEIKDKTTSDTEEIPSLELSLKRLRGSGDVGNDAHDERNVLRHSDVSAFSRYNMGCTANQAPTGNVGSCSPVDNSSDAMKAESLYHQKSNGSSNNNDMGSTTKNICTKPAAINDKSAAISTARCLTPSASKPPGQSGHTCPPINTPQKADTVVTTKVISQPRGSHQQVQVQHHHHHYHHHHYHVKDKQQQQPPPEGDDVSLNVGTSDVQCGSSNVFGAVEGNGGNYSLNGSVSGSNHASNLLNRSSKAANVDGMCVESDNGKTEAGGASGSGNSVEPNRFAQREAALNKFRQKRKDRCFEKKVRYQSRKKLAEQRPRVRGQFVRQAVYKHKSREENS